MTLCQQLWSSTTLLLWEMLVRHSVEVVWCAQTQHFTSLVQGLALIVSVFFGGEVEERIHGRISSLWRGSECLLFPVFDDVLSQLNAGERWLVLMQHFCGSFSFRQWMTHLSVGKKIFLLVLKAICWFCVYVIVSPSSHAVSIYHSVFSFSAVFSHNESPNVGVVHL